MFCKYDCIGGEALFESTESGSKREITRASESGCLGLSTPARVAKFWNFSGSGKKRAHQIPLCQVWVLAMLAGWLLLGVPSNALAQPQNQASTADNVAKQVHGIRLLTPSTFAFDLPTANISPPDLSVVDTIDDNGQPVVGRVHVKVGEHYVVMLPIGNLVARKADQVAASSKRFRAASKKQIRDEVSGQLANFSGMKYEKSANYIFAFNTSDRFQQVTKGTLESMLKGVRKYCEAAGIETKKPDLPLVVIMFRTERQFQAFRKTQEGVLAYYDPVSNYIVLREESPLGDDRPDLVQNQLLSTIAHEGAHQILHNIGVQQRLSMWPIWLSEGLAEYMAPTSIGKRNRWKGAGDINDLRMYELETFLQSRYIQGFDGQFLKNIVTTQTLTSTGYATSWSLVHYLAKKDKKQFHKYISQLRSIGPLTGMVASPNESVAANLDHYKAFFGEDFEAEERELVEYLTKLEYDSPMENFVHYVGMAIIPADGGKFTRNACFFHRQESVEQWKAVLDESLDAENVSGMKWDVRKVNTRREALQLMSKFRRGR